MLSFEPPPLRAPKMTDEVPLEQMYFIFMCEFSPFLGTLAALKK